MRCESERRLKAIFETKSPNNTKKGRLTLKIMLYFVKMLQKVLRNGHENILTTTPIYEFCLLRYTDSDTYRLIVQFLIVFFFVGKSSVLNC